MKVCICNFFFKLGFILVERRVFSLYLYDISALKTTVHFFSKEYPTL